MSVQLVVASGSRVGQVIPIVGDRFVIGRADDCNLKPRSELISRYHCEISLVEGDVFVRDMGSKNGVFLNDNQITETKELNHGDKLAIGPLEFLVQLTVEMKSQKPAKVRSVGDAVARTVAIQAEGAQKNQDEAITDWLLAAGESDDEAETRTVDASELMNHLHAQSQEAANRDKEGEDDTGTPSKSGIINPASSRDAASELLRKFFKGGK
jgi:pSer/pThr/pTyr-binding forkhead associated (FHA) protein